MSAPDAHASVGEARELGGRYRLVRYIAKGGMAEVWEGYDNVLSRPVAVKILLAHLATDSNVLERFRREAITAARLAHPGVIATYDTGVDHGTAWIVMELVRGRTLRHLMNERGQIDPALAVRIAGQITDALAHAHKHGLVHRDVKPGNVLLCDDEGPVPRAKVTDFGIAKATESLGGLDLTKTGIVLGTPKYLSPEQVEGIEPDARADLYSLGVVLFEMLTGQPPFTGPTDMAVALAHLRDEPPRVLSLCSSVPDELDDIVAGLLVKDRDRRTPSAVALRQELASAARHLGDGRHAANGHSSNGQSGKSGNGQSGNGQGRARTSTGNTGPVIAGGVGGSPGTGWAGSPPDASPSGASGGEHGVSRVDGTPGGSTGPRRVANGWGPPAAAGPGRPPGGQPMTGRGTTRSEAAVGRGGDLSTRVEGARAGGGPVPAASPSRRPPATRSARSRRGPGMVVASLIVVGVVVIGFLLAHGRSGNGPSPASSGSTPAAGTPVSIVNATELVAAGHTADNPSDLKYLYDGSAATSWSTEIYSTPAFGGYYKGLGVVLQLHGSHTLQQLVVTSSTPGWSAQAYVAAADPPTSSFVGGWGTPTDTKNSINGGVTLSLGGKKGSWVMLWLTNLGPNLQIKISEVAVN